MDIMHSSSPNFDDRRHPVDMLVLHYTGMETGQAAFDQLRNPDAKVSSHYLLWEDGRVHQLVPEDRRAWHAGVSSWRGDGDLNSRSIGIEIVNGGHDFPMPDGSLPPYPAVQIEALIALCRAILARHNIPQTRIVGHSDIAPLRKQDPGEHFPWERLAEANIGYWPSVSEETAGPGLRPGDTGPGVETLQRHLAGIGYGLKETGVFDTLTEAVVSTFQRRWRPDRVSGIADPQTLARIGAVSAVYTAG